jgi:hypothetical protein
MDCDPVRSSIATDVELRVLAGSLVPHDDPATARRSKGMGVS